MAASSHGKHENTQIRDLLARQSLAPLRASLPAHPASAKVVDFVTNPQINEMHENGDRGGLSGGGLVTKSTTLAEQTKCLRPNL